MILGEHLIDVSSYYSPDGRYSESESVVSVPPNRLVG